MIALGLIQLQPAELFPPAVVSLHGDLCFHKNPGQVHMLHGVSIPNIAKRGVQSKPPLISGIPLTICSLQERALPRLADKVPN